MKEVGKINENVKKAAYKGIRMRKWGKWVAEIREPNKRSRIWLGSYSSPLAAARAYDTALFLLRGPSARLNFPHFFSAAKPNPYSSAAAVRKIAADVGARVDAALAHRPPPHRRVDLNELPDPEDSDADLTT